MVVSLLTIGDQQMAQPIKQKLEATVSMPSEHIRRKPDDEDSEDYDMFHAVAEDLISAILSHDVPGCAEALRAAFELADSEPHSEGPHTED